MSGQSLIRSVVFTLEPQDPQPNDLGSGSRRGCCEVLGRWQSVGASRADADTYPRQPGIDARHYVFRVTLLTGDSNEIHGEARR